MLFDNGIQAPVDVTVLVTGANGLVGRAVCIELAKRGHRVLAAVRHPSSDSLFSFQQGIEIVQAPDLTNPLATWPLADVDAVVHTAAHVHVMNPTPDEAKLFFTVNRNGSEILARQCAAHGVKRLVFLSTIKVNGEATRPGEAFKSTDPPAPHNDPYALSKLQAETVLKAVAQETGLQVAVIRPPLVYGPGAKGNLGLLERLVRKRMPLPIGALHFNRRSLVSLVNLIDLTVCCVTHPAAANATFLVSDKHDVSTLELTRLIAGACAVAPVILWVPAKALSLVARLCGRHDMFRRLSENLQVDINDTCKRLDWQPPQTIEQAMTAAFARGITAGDTRSS